MSLTQTKRSRIKVAGILSDAQPTFVSLVQHGANQTPFKVIKTATAPATMDKTPLVTKGISLQKGVEINRIEFLSAKFSSAPEVAVYMKSQSFDDGYTIEEAPQNTDGISFVVKGIDAASFAEEPAKIELSEDGVRIFAGQLKEELSKTAESPAAPPTEDNKEKKSEEKKPVWVTAKGEGMVQKFDWYLSRYSNGTTIKDVVADATSDGLPLGFEDLSASFNTAFSNVVKSGELSQIPVITQEYGTLLSKLANFTESNLTTKSDMVKSFFENLVKSSETSPPTALKAEDFVSKTEFEAVSTTLNSAEARLKALEELLPGLAKKEDVTAAKTEVEGLLKKSADSLESRVAATEGLRQTRKSGEVENTPPPGEKTPERAPLSKMEKNLAGLRD